MPTQSLNLDKKDLTEFLVWVADEGIDEELYTLGSGASFVLDEDHDPEIEAKLFEFTQKLIQAIGEVIGLDINQGRSQLHIGITSYTDSPGRWIQTHDPERGFTNAFEMESANTLVCCLGNFKFLVHHRGNEHTLNSGEVFLANDGTEVGFQYQRPNTPGPAVFVMYTGESQSHKEQSDFIGPRIHELFENKESIERIIELLRSIDNDRLWSEALDYIECHTMGFSLEGYTDYEAIELLHACPKRLWLNPHRATLNDKFTLVITDNDPLPEQFDLSKLEIFTGEVTAWIHNTYGFDLRELNKIPGLKMVGVYDSSQVIKDDTLKFIVVSEDSSFVRPPKY